MGVEVNYDLEYQGEEARGLASKALNYMFQATCQISRDQSRGTAPAL